MAFAFGVAIVRTLVHVVFGTFANGFWILLHFNHGTYKALDAVEFPHIVFVDERDCFPFRIRTSGSTYTVNVVFWGVGHIKIDNQGDILDVDSAT